MEINAPKDNPFSGTPPLFVVEMRWGQQPVRLTAWRCCDIPTDGPITSVHIVAWYEGRVLVVKDRKGGYGFPGGRLESGETREQALAREVHEEANAHLTPGYALFAALRIECTKRLPNRAYPHPFTYMTLYAGEVRALEPLTRDPAGIVQSRALFSPDDCRRFLLPHDRTLLHEAVTTLTARLPDPEAPPDATGLAEVIPFPEQSLPEPTREPALARVNAARLRAFALSEAEQTRSLRVGTMRRKAV